MMVPMREIRGCMPGGFCCAWRAAGAGGVLMGTGIPGVVFWEKGGREEEEGRKEGGRGKGGGRGGGRREKEEEEGREERNIQGKRNRYTKTNLKHSDQAMHARIFHVISSCSVQCYASVIVVRQRGPDMMPHHSKNQRALMTF